MAVVREAFDEAISVPSRRGFRPEEVGPHIVVYADDEVEFVGEENNGFAADKPAEPVMSATFICCQNLNLERKTGRKERLASAYRRA
jgi:hypothetical protein